MDALASKIQGKYIDDLALRYPVHRFFILFMYLIAIYSLTSTNGSVFETIQGMKINFIFDYKKGFLNNVTFLHLFIGFICTFIGIISYTALKAKAFNILLKRYPLKVYTENLEYFYKEKKPKDDMTRFYISKDIAQQLEKERKKLNSYHTHSETLLSIVFIFILDFSNIDLKEIAIPIILVLFILFNQWRSFIFYIRKIIPYYISEKVLLGGNIEIKMD
jgi:hypothetical protein